MIEIGETYDHHCSDGTVERRAVTKEQLKAFSGFVDQANKQRAERGLAPITLKDMELAGYWESAHE